MFCFSELGGGGWEARAAAALNEALSEALPFNNQNLLVTTIIVPGSIPTTQQ